MKYLLYRILVRMLRLNDEHPVLRSFVYISIVHISIFCALLIFIKALLKKITRINIVEEYFSNSPYLFWLVVVGLIPLLYTYFRFFYKKSMDIYITKYENHWLNKYFKEFYLFLTPLLILLLGILFTIFLFGGYIMEREIRGIWY